MLVHFLATWRIVGAPVIGHRSTHTQTWSHYAMITIKYLHIHAVSLDRVEVIINLRAAGQSKFQIPTAVSYISILLHFLTGHGVYPPYYSKGTGAFPEDKASEESGNSPSTVTKVKEEWSYSSTPPIRLHGMHKGNVTFLLLSLHVVRLSFEFTITRNGCASFKNGNHLVKKRRLVVVSGFESGAAIDRA